MSEPARLVPAEQLLPVVAAALRRGQRVRMAVTGGSMSPFLRAGDEVELVALQGPPRVGQVVLGQLPTGQYVLHRVVAVRERQCWTRGDAVNHQEGPIGTESLLGQAVATTRRGRTWSLDRASTRMLNRLWQATRPWSTRLLRLVQRLRHGR